jgi:hypothetical protein
LCRTQPLRLLLLLCLQNPPPVDVIVTKRVVNSNTATLGSGDLPTFNFEIKLTAEAGTTVTNPVLVDTMSAGLQIQGAIGASNGEEQLALYIHMSRRHVRHTADTVVMTECI